MDDLDRQLKHAQNQIPHPLYTYSIGYRGMTIIPVELLNEGQYDFAIADELMENIHHQKEYFPSLEAALSAGKEFIDTLLLQEELDALSD